jgi:signal transduction histidine kinase
MEDPNARDLMLASRQAQGYAPRMSLALPGWMRRPSDRTKDVALAVLLALPVVGSGISEAVKHGQPMYVPVAVAAVVALWWRRAHPIAVLAAVLLIGLGLSDTVIVQLVGVVVLYQVAATRRPPVIAACVGAIMATVAVHFGLWGGHGDLAGALLGTAVLCGVSVAFGLGTANRRANVAALNERAERLELQAEQALQDERVRIARELHDVVAHNVSLMVVQAQALGATVKEPQVVEATTGIADLGRQAMTEMHRTLELLRGRDGSSGRAPRPGLGNLGTLVEQSRDAGLDVDLTIEGPPRELSDSLDLSAFRIVQEALTNVRKHAAGASAHVKVAYHRSVLDLTVLNAAGAVSSANGGGGGHGITGMRERVQLFGGRLEAGPLRDGFEVHATLPYDEGPSA